MRTRYVVRLFLAALPPSMAIYLMYYLVSTSLPSTRQPSGSTWLAWLPAKPPPPDPRFLAAVRTRADSSGFLVLAMTDKSFVDMAVNLYEISFQRRGIHNFLFAAIGQDTCQALVSAGVPEGGCVYYADDPMSNNASQFGSKDFLRKTNMRTKMIMDALAANVTVLHTDVDVAFFTNPIKELKEIMMSTNMAALWDHGSFNAGFLVVRPTTQSREVYEKMWQMTTSNPSTDDQSAMNAVIYKLLRKRWSLSLHLRDKKDGAHGSGLAVILRLDQKRFTCGVEYFEKPEPKVTKTRVGRRLVVSDPHGGRFQGEWSPLGICGKTTTSKSVEVGWVKEVHAMASRPCVDVVHNNWIVGKKAKVFRFREHLLWSYDPNGEYYGSTKAKYLTYSTVSRLSATQRSSTTAARPDALNATASVAKNNTNREQNYVIADDQVAQLRTALAYGHLLNRIVILPRFHCRFPNETKANASTNNDCPLNALLDVESFDGVFSNRYRESTFLRHPKVPEDVRQGLSAPLDCICGQTPLADASMEGGNVSRDVTTSGKVWRQRTPVTSDDIVRKFGGLTDRVLVFNSFAAPATADEFDDNDCFPTFFDRQDGDQFRRMLSKGLVRNDYRQMNKRETSKDS